MFSKYYAAQIVLKSTLLLLCIVALGAILSYTNNVTNHLNYKNIYSNNNTQIQLVLNEPLVVKPNSYKALANVQYTITNGIKTPASGTVIVYLQKDSIATTLDYGSTIITNQAPKLITNTGNPGAFNYQLYCLRNGITHQIYIASNKYVVLPQVQGNWVQAKLYRLQAFVLQVLQKNITTPNERSIAEALLIGYRSNVDKDLLQVYSNTGTVHVIAISGLHLGFIYMLLLVLFKPFTSNKVVSNIVQPIVIITILWTFSLLAGAAPSILRSALMFTCIIIGNSMQRQLSVYNSLAASAFIILCINPFALWDVGFQLSYAALLSIVLFMQPIYKLLYVPNKVLNWLWQLNAVTISAQLLTLPLVLFYFKQFPYLFIITNMVAVPLSTIILGMLLLLVSFNWISYVALFVGKLTTWVIGVMNTSIQWCSNIPYATASNIQVNLVQVYLLFALIIAMGYWLLRKYNKAAIAALMCIFLFLLVNVFANYTTMKQQKLVVYNLPKLSLIDVVTANQYSTISDTTMAIDTALYKYNVKPSRQVLGLGKANAVGQQAPLYQFGNNAILVINKPYVFNTLTNKPTLQYTILANNPLLYIDSLLQYFTLKQVIADASNPTWKVKLWQADCLRLGIPFYNVAIEGAFVVNLN